MARFVWAVGSQTAELTLTEPMKFREGSLGRARTRYRSTSLDQRTTVTELLTSTGADIMVGRVRFVGDPSLLSSMVEDAASGALLTYEHSNGVVVFDLLLEDAGPLTEVKPDANRFGFGEWERTLRLRHVGEGSNLLSSPEAFDAGDWALLNSPTVVANVGLAPDGTATADSVEDDSAVNLQRVQQTATDVAGRYLFSVFVQKSRTGDGFPTLRALVSESTAQKTPEVNFDPVGGTTALIGDTGVVLDSGLVDLGAGAGGWVYVYMVVDHDASGATFAFGYAPARTASVGGAFDSTTVSKQTVWGAQVVKLDDAWTSGNALPAYVPNSKRVLWQLFPPVTI